MCPAVSCKPLSQIFQHASMGGRISLSYRSPSAQDRYRYISGNPVPRNRQKFIDIDPKSDMLNWFANLSLFFASAFHANSSISPTPVCSPNRGFSRSCIEASHAALVRFLAFVVATPGPLVGSSSSSSMKSLSESDILAGWAREGGVTLGGSRGREVSRTGEVRRGKER